MSCKCSLNDRLEAERYDLSWLSPAKPKTEILRPECNRRHSPKCTRQHNPVCTRLHVDPAEQEERDSIFLCAGRYLAGHRDSAAVNAYKIFEELLGK